MLVATTAAAAGGRALAAGDDPAPRVGADVVAWLGLSPGEKAPVRGRPPAERTSLAAVTSPRTLVPVIPPKAAVVTAAHTAALTWIHRFKGFDLDRVRAGAAAVPRLYLMTLPPDIAAIEDVERRKAVFLRAVLPLVLMANEEIRALRARASTLLRRRAAGGVLDRAQQAWLTALFARYGVEDGDRDALFRRLDTVPVSLALAQAIQESGWGRSRFARVGNALFGQRTWDAATPGFIPDEREAGEKHRVRAFPDLMAATRIYMHNLNTHPAYGKLRDLRARARAEGRAPDSEALAATLLRYAEHGAGYVEALHAILRSNRLTDFDRAHLSGTAYAGIAAQESQGST